MSNDAPGIKKEPDTARTPRLFLHTPLGHNLERALDAIRETGLFDLCLGELTATDFDRLIASRPCVCVFSVLDAQSGKEIRKLLQNFNEHRISRGRSPRDPSLRIVVIADSRELPFERWQPIGVHEFIFAPIAPRSLAFKISRHHQKAFFSEAPPPLQNDEKIWIKGAPKDLVAELILVKGSPITGAEVYRIAPSSRFDHPSETLATLAQKHPEQTRELELKIHLPQLDPDAGEWRPVQPKAPPPASSIQDDAYWEWVSNPAPEGLVAQKLDPRVKSSTLRYVGERPVRVEGSRSWIFRGKTPKLLIRDERQAEEQILCIANELCSELQVFTASAIQMAVDAVTLQIFDSGLMTLQDPDVRVESPIEITRPAQNFEELSEIYEKALSLGLSSRTTAAAVSQPPPHPLSAGSEESADLPPPDPEAEPNAPQNTLSPPASHRAGEEASTEVPTENFAEPSQSSSRKDAVVRDKPSPSTQSEQRSKTRGPAHVAPSEANTVGQDDLARRLAPPSREEKLRTAELELKLKAGRLTEPDAASGRVFKYSESKKVGTGEDALDTAPTPSNSRIARFSSEPTDHRSDPAQRFDKGEAPPVSRTSVHVNPTAGRSSPFTVSGGNKSEAGFSIQNFDEQLNPRSPHSRPNTPDTPNAPATTPRESQTGPAARSRSLQRLRRLMGQRLVGQADSLGPEDSTHSPELRASWVLRLREWLKSFFLLFLTHL